MSSTSKRRPDVVVVCPNEARRARIAHALNPLASRVETHPDVGTACLYGSSNVGLIVLQMRGSEPVDLVHTARLRGLVGTDCRLLVLVAGGSTDVARILAELKPVAPDRVQEDPDAAPDIRHAAERALAPRPSVPRPDPLRTPPASEIAPPRQDERPPTEEMPRLPLRPRLSPAHPPVQVQPASAARVERPTLRPPRLDLVPPTPVAPSPTSPPRPPTRQLPNADADERTPVDVLRSEHERMRDADHFARVRLSRDALDLDVKLAIEGALRRFNPSLVDVETPEDRQRLTEIHAWLRESFDVLRRPAARAAYLAGQPVPPPPAPPSNPARDKLLATGRQRAQAGDYEGAIALFEGAVAMRSCRVSAFELALCRGHLASKRGDSAEARRYFGLAASDPPPGRADEVAAALGALDAG